MSEFNFDAIDEERLIVVNNYQQLSTISLCLSFSGRGFIRRENEPDFVVKLERNDNKKVREGRNKYIEKSERTYFQYVPTIQIR